MKRGVILALALSWLVACKGEEKKETKAQAPSCPSKLAFQEKLKPLVGEGWQVVSVEPLKDLNLCAVVLKKGFNTFVLYMDPKLNYLISGHVIDVRRQVNVSRELANKYARVTEKELKKLEELTDLKFNEGAKKYVYFISDPDCPFCRKTEPILKEWAKKRGVEIRHIFFPLPMHPEAFDKAVDIVCSKKGYEYVHKDFKPENLCEEGRKKIERNVKELSQMGVSSTPTIVGMTGKVITGLPSDEKVLDELIR
ncbi:MAG: DsbC family protein [Aquificae bacterium]|nr:DsbC family protein [Aquificota bacterium]